MVSHRIWVVLFACAVAYGQTTLDLRSQSRNVDLSGANYTKPFKTGTSLPATCSVGEVFFKSNALAGRNIYLCASQNLWSAADTVPPPAGGPAIFSTDGDDTYWALLSDISISSLGGSVSEQQLPSGINTVKLGDGSVTSAAFNRLAGVRSNIQTQLDAKTEVITNLNGGLVITGSGITRDLAPDWNVLMSYIVSSGPPPASCAQGQMNFDQSGQVLYFCSVPNSWVRLASQSRAEQLDNKTLTQPAIADFSLAAHSHQDGQGGGQLSISALAPSARSGNGTTLVTTTGTQTPGTCAQFDSSGNLVGGAPCASTTELESALHAPTHRHGGSDEVAVAVAAANAIPKATASGALDRSWAWTIDNDAPAYFEPWPLVGSLASFPFSSANRVYLQPFQTSTRVPVGKIVYHVNTADVNANLAFGIYNETLSKVAEIRTSGTGVDSTGAKDVSLAGATSLAPGFYYLAFASSSTTLALGSMSPGSPRTMLLNRSMTRVGYCGTTANFAAAAGSVLPSSCTITAQSINLPFVLLEP